MPSRVGHLTDVHDDGTVRIKNEITGEEWFGQLIVMSGGMICFDVRDERLRSVNGQGYDPENGEAPIEARDEGSNRTRVAVGPSKRNREKDPDPAAA